MGIRNPCKNKNKDPIDSEAASSYLREAPVIFLRRKEDDVY
jgi:hypothetical protein